MSDEPIETEVIERSTELAQRAPDAAAVALPEQTGRVMSMIEKAIDSGKSGEDLKAFVDLYEKIEGIEARKAFNQALAMAAQCAPEIPKTRKVRFMGKTGPVEYNHAELPRVTKILRKWLAPFGLSINWRCSESAKAIHVTAVLQHVQGYSIESSMTLPPDTSGGKNAIQACGSSRSYGKRYSALDVCGLAEDEDNDGADAPRLDPPDRDESAPKAAPRGGNKANPKKAAVRKLYARWADAMGYEVATADRDEFLQWAAGASGLSVEKLDKAENWTDDAVEKCGIVVTEIEEDHR